MSQGNLGNLKNFDQSHVMFRSIGDVSAEVVFDVEASLSFTTGPQELFGAQNFGANFRVPGIVTIGPNFRVIGQLSGQADLHA
jgi:chitinase